MAPATSNYTAADVEALAMRLAKQHAARSEAEAKATSRAAIAGWGEPVPACLQPSIDELVDDNRCRWLRSAERLVTVCDWRAFTGGRTFHVLDFAAAGIYAGPASATWGMAVGAQLHEFAAHAIPKLRLSTPTAAVAVNVNLAVQTFRPANQADIEWLGELIAGIALHEYSHVLDHQAAETWVSCSLAEARELLARPVQQTPERHRQGHGPRWLRAYAHLVNRCRDLRGAQVRQTLFNDDATESGLTAAAVLEALAPELGDDRQILDIIKTPAPAAYQNLLNGDDDHARNL